MTSNGGQPGAARGWADRVRFADGPVPIAYRHRQVIFPAAEVDRVVEVIEELGLRGDGFDIELLGQRPEEEPPRRNLPARFALAIGVEDPPVAVRELRAEGIAAQLNHVLFAHCAHGCCGPHPAQVAAACGGVVGSPVYATPVYATPVYATPVYATPVYATPVYATGEIKATGQRRSSAVPVSELEAVEATARLHTAAAGSAAVDADVVVFDTGVPHDDFRSATLGIPHSLSAAVDSPDGDGNERVDPVAGHGEFIAGLIKSVAPNARVAVIDVLELEGDGNEANIGTLINTLPDVRARGGAVINLSFGTYVQDADGLFLATAILAAQSRGWVVVASAGNDGVCLPTYPAALPDVVSVGAIGPHGPAMFTNYGPWVRACAPGVDLISTFFNRYDKDKEMGPLGGWAKWSGTSFSAPIVAGSIVQEMQTRGLTATEAVARLVDACGLMRINGLGTVINRL